MDQLGFFLFAVAAVAAVILFMLRRSDAARAASATSRLERVEKELSELKADSSSRKETLEARTKELAEVKDKLRDAKKRLHDEKGTHRKQEIDHARAEAEREAQAQIEAARQQAAELQLEIKRLQSELEVSRGKKRPATAEKVEVKVDLTAKPDEKPAEAAQAAPVESKPRELTKVEQDRIQLLERQAVKQAERVKQLEEENKRHQRRAESNDKAFKAARGEVELVKAKMSGIEKRLNQTLLELDKLRAKAFKAGMANEITAAQAEADAELASQPAVSASTSPADVPLPAPEAKA